MTTASTRIAKFAANFSKVPLTQDQRHRVYRAFLDTFGVAAGGRNDDAPRLMREYMRTVAGTGKASVWATGDLLPAESAACVNGVASHVLDYDDQLPPMRGHPSVGVIPALTALAQVTGADGKLFSSAYIAGYEVLTKISKVIAMKQATKGWHTTATLGILGGATACSVVLGLSEQQIVNALGLAVTQAGGNRGNFGTMSKCFQVGQCGAAAVRAALLAQAGYNAPADALDSKYGYAVLYGHGEDLSKAFDTLGKEPLEFDTIGLDVKKYPCCYASHKTIDGMLSLRAKHGLTLGAVDRVDITTNALGMQPLTYHNPTTELEAKFSMEYPAAAALLDGKVVISTFDDDQIMRPEIRAFLPKVKAQEAEGEVLPRWADIKVTLKNGNTLQERVTTSRGDFQYPLTDDELVEKAQDCFSFGKYNWQAKAFAADVFNLSNLRVDDVVRRCIAG